MSALLPLAHHSLVVALPFVLPPLILTVGVLLFAVRERRRRAAAGKP